MLNYIVKRILILFPVLAAVSAVIFLIMHFAPGDPAVLSLGQMATPQDIENLREKMGLNDPLHVQYLNFLLRAVRGDFGKSFYTDQPVFHELLCLFPATLELAFASMFIAMVVGVVAGIISAVKQDSIFDNASMVVAVGGVSMPVFWLGLMLLWVFSLKLDLFPISGRMNVRIDLQTVTGLYVLDSLIRWNMEAFKSALSHLVLPSITLATIPVAIIARFTRSSMLEVIRQEYIRTARSKGLSEGTVILKHALKNALISVVTVVGLQFGLLLAGAVVTETVFSWPGIGYMIITSIGRRDYPVVQGALLFIACIYAVINLIVDISYSYFDPRIRY